MAKISIVAENGEYIQQEVLSRNVAFFETDFVRELDYTERNVEKTEYYYQVSDDNSIFKPKVAQRVEYDHQGDVSQTTTVCGETEKRRDADEGPEITVEGIIVEDQIPRLKSLKGRDVTMISDVHSGPVYVGRVTVEQNTDIIHYIENGEKQLAFTFQLQTGEQSE